MDFQFSIKGDDQVTDQADPLRRLLDPSYPLCREDVVWALGFIKRKVAEGAPEWSGLDRPQLLARFACYAELSMLLLNRRSLCGADAACLRALLSDMLPGAGRAGPD